MSTCSVGKREEEAQMFNESWPWKRELGECANQLRAAGQVTHWESLDVADSEDSYEAEAKSPRLRCATCSYTATSFTSLGIWRGSASRKPAFFRKMTQD